MPSKLLRVLQEQGRAQLQMGWGSPESPSCRGLTVEELSRIDFSRLDLSEIYGEIMEKYKASSTKLDKSALQKTFEAKAQMMEEGAVSFSSKDKKPVLEKEEQARKEKRREILDKAAREQKEREAIQRRYRA